MTTGTPLSIADLLEGSAHEYIFFWGETPEPDGSIGASCLSQWFSAPFTVDGVRYPTAEHWMMAAKARLFGDEESERQVLAAGVESAHLPADRLGLLRMVGGGGSTSSASP